MTSLMAPPLLRWTLGHVQLSEAEKERFEMEQRRRASFVGNLKRVLLPTRGGLSSRIATQVVGLMINEEDVELTKIHVLASSNNNLSCVDGRGVKRDHIDGHFVDVRSVARSDNGNGVSSVVLSEAERGYDLLVIGATERRGNGDGPLFNRFVDDIIQNSPCPLMIVSARTEQLANHLNLLSLRHILLPINGSENDRYAAEVAFSIARNRADIVVDVVHVVNGPQHTSRLGEERAVLHAMELGEDLLSKIAEIGHSMRATVRTDVLVADSPSNAIIERAQRRADLIVLSSNRRPVTQRAFFGHGTDHILRESPCPVAVVSIN
jgi:nucleotide-binding universal stress UspA family protein